jgi:hypothetical protein
MTEESGPTGAPVAISGPAGATTSRPSEHAESNSRIETHLWLLFRGRDRAEARMCVKFGRRDFRVYVNGELLWSRNYAFDDTQSFDALSAAKREEFVGQGWVAPGHAPASE